MCGRWEAGPLRLWPWYSPCPWGQREGCAPRSKLPPNQIHTHAYTKCLISLPHTHAQCPAGLRGMGSAPTGEGQQEPSLVPLVTPPLPSPTPEWRGSCFPPMPSSRLWCRSFLPSRLPCNPCSHCPSSSTKEWEKPRAFGARQTQEQHHRGGKGAKKQLVLNPCEPMGRQQGRDRGCDATTRIGPFTAPLPFISGMPTSSKF